MIRVVLAVVLSGALLGASLPVVERAERDRNAALATAELTAPEDRAARLVADNDPVAARERPASTTIRLAPPSPVLTASGRIVLDDDRLVWAPTDGTNRTVAPSVPLRVETPISITGPTRLRLSLLEAGGGGTKSTVDERGRPRRGSDRPDRPTGGSRGIARPDGP